MRTDPVDIGHLAPSDEHRHLSVSRTNSILVILAALA